jgi:hypothetical protein
MGVRPNQTKGNQMEAALIPLVCAVGLIAICILSEATGLINLHYAPQDDDDAINPIIIILEPEGT